MIIRWSDNKGRTVRRQNFHIQRQQFLNNYFSVEVAAPIDDSGFFAKARLSGDQFIRGVLSGSKFAKGTLSRLIFSKGLLNG
jgi:hypothetical protein